MGCGDLLVSWNSNLAPTAVRRLYCDSEMSHSDHSEGVVAGTRPGKRERLVRAASELVHHQGVEKTTLAEIAEAADVPLGNVYYYFKTKDALLDAVVEAHVRGIEETIASLGASSDTQSAASRR